MKFRKRMSIALISLLTVPVVPLQLAAQDQALERTSIHHHYKLIDLGTFGGPNSSNVYSPTSQSVNNRGVVVGGAETPASDPFAPNCQDANCLILHAFEWTDGRLSDLGTLPGGSDSTAFWINDSGQIIGNSENGVIDPLTGLPATIGVLWDHGQTSI